MTRLEWKRIWRLLRIARRESYKVWEDTLIYGIGYAEIGSSVPDLIRHVPIEKVMRAA